MLFRDDHECKAMTDGDAINTLAGTMPISDHPVDPGGRRRRSPSEGGSVRSGFPV